MSVASLLSETINHEAVPTVQLYLVTLAAIILYREGILALVMAGAARFTGLHVAHGSLQGTSLEREYFGVAIRTFV